MNHLINRLKNVRGVIHVGAHFGEEATAYEDCGIRDICWIEPSPHAFAKLLEFRSASDDLFFNCALGVEAGIGTLMIASNEGHSSSLRRPTGHLSAHPEVTFSESLTVPIQRLSDLKIDFSRYNLLVMDVQGGELDVLRGSGAVLDSFDYIVAECQRHELYEGSPLLPELTEWLFHRGFALERVEWQTESWGNALFVHERAFKWPTVHAFIFHWGNDDRGRSLAAKASLLRDLIEPHVDRLSIISSGGVGAGQDWTVIGRDAHFGTQWNRALMTFEADVLFHHQCDALLIGADYEALVDSARASFRSNHCGVYAPRVDHSAWDCSHSRLQERCLGSVDKFEI